MTAAFLLSVAGCAREPENTQEAPSETARVATFELKNQIPPCNASRFGQVYYVKRSEQFYYCDGNRLIELDVVGTPGSDGTSWLVLASDAATGTCPKGGVILSLGPDTDRDGVLDANEITSTHAICAGEDGAPGPKGDVGKTALISTSPASTNACPYGGIAVAFGVDDDGDGVLDPEEVDDVRTVCNGAPGSDGAPALIEQTPEPPSSECPHGGIRIDTGIDDDQNGELSSAEIDDTTLLCHGAPIVDGGAGSDGGTTDGGDGGDDIGDPPVPGDLLVNEVLLDGFAGDANCNGIVTGDDDDFVEIVNIADRAVQLQGVLLSNSLGPSHVFGPLLLGPGEVASRVPWKLDRRSSRKAFSSIGNQAAGFKALLVT